MKKIPDINFLKALAYQLRVDCLKATTAAGSGHPTSCLSAAEIAAVLFFQVMNYNPAQHGNPDNDRFILSKGHAAPLLYAVYKELGFLSEEELLTLRTFDSPLEGHPASRFIFNEAATGSLGQGLSIGAGMAIKSKRMGPAFNTYVLMGDSEVAEGSIWEAASVAAFYKLDNLIGILDVNRLGQSTQTMEGDDLSQYEARWQAFGWNTLKVDGHSIAALLKAFDAIPKNKKPTIIIASTQKGYGLPSIENKEGFHGKAFKKEELSQLLPQLKARFKEDADYQIPKVTLKKYNPAPAQFQNIKLDAPAYKIGETIATRKAFGQALANAGKKNKEIMSLDAEVKNSTFAELFEKEFPDRFVQCFIAEQNMIGMAVGCQARGAIPVASTFGCFFTRAFDQLRMAAIGRVPLRLVGSHAGVSIGEDGPSQMALEDIAMMRTLPDSVVLYPCDGTSAWKLVELMVNHHESISYLRTTRGDTPIIYDANTSFKIGGCKVLKESDRDVACIIAAGITLHEALKAYEELKKQHIMVSIIDLYSIKPLDQKTILSVAKKSGNRIITVEDHYLEGGLGQAVSYAVRNENVNIDCLAVTKLPRSGKPQELLAFENIDAAAIMKAIEKKN